MKEADLRRWHRQIGIVVAPLVILQAASGVFLSVDWLLGIHQRIGETVRENMPPLARLWDAMLIEIHYGIGKAGAVYHIALGIVVIWLAVSGFMMFLRVRRRMKDSLHKSGKQEGE